MIDRKDSAKVGVPIAVKAAKVALIALGLVLLFGAIVLGLIVGIHSLFGGWGLLVAWLLVVFGVLWLCAALDLNAKSETQE